MYATSYEDLSEFIFNNARDCSDYRIAQAISKHYSDSLKWS